MSECDRSAVQARRATASRLAHSAPQLRESPRHEGCSVESGSGVDGARYDRNDDEVFPSQPSRGCRGRKGSRHSRRTQGGHGSRFSSKPLILGANLSAQGGTRTRTPCGATPSRWCVYQFHHLGLASILLSRPALVNAESATSARSARRLRPPESPPPPELLRRLKPALPSPFSPCSTPHQDPTRPRRASPRTTTRAR